MAEERERESGGSSWWGKGKSIVFGRGSSGEEVERGLVRVLSGEEELENLQTPKVGSSSSLRSDVHLFDVHHSDSLSYCVKARSGMLVLILSGRHDYRATRYIYRQKSRTQLTSVFPPPNTSFHSCTSLLIRNTEHRS